MNILLIDVEDFTAEAVGCYGNPIVRTPNIDKLAREGVMFTNAYCNAVMCNPSRSSFLTGLRPQTTRIYDNPTWMSNFLPEDATHLAEVMKSKGAYVANIGKLYHNPGSARDQYNAFDRLEHVTKPEGFKGIQKGGYKSDCPERRFRYSDDPEIESEMLRLEKQRIEMGKSIPRTHPDWVRKVWRPFQSLWQELIGDCGIPAECTRDRQIANLAAEIIKEQADKNQQFFLSVGLQEPHTPVVAAKEFIDLYDTATIELPVSDGKKDYDIPAVAKRFGRKPDIFTGRNTDILPQLKYSEGKAKQVIAAYYGCASSVDANVGLMLDALVEAGVDDNTIVLFFSDHGFHLGEHGLWSKYTMFEQVTRVPFIMYVPGVEGNGQTSSAIVELVDLLPTLADLWGITPQSELEGISILPVLEDPDIPWKKAAFTSSNMNGAMAHSIRTEQYRYTEWKNDALFEKELYNINIDPGEHRNLVNDPGYLETLTEMAETLHNGRKQALSE